MASTFRVIATSFMLLAILVLCKASRPTINPTVAVAAGQCHPKDISIQQGEASGVGIPVWEVQVVNTCTSPLCMVSQVVVQCGQFHSATLVNPNVFKRLDSRAGTCIVNNGGRVANAQTVTFQYSEVMKQPLTLKSAKVTCW